MAQINDAQTQEWIDALDALIAKEGADNAHALLE